MAQTFEELVASSSRIVKKRMVFSFRASSGAVRFVV
mgnify:CR=1 FL=1